MKVNDNIDYSFPVFLLYKNKLIIYQSRPRFFLFLFLYDKQTSKQKVHTDVCINLVPSSSVFFYLLYIFQKIKN